MGKKKAGLGGTHRKGWKLRRPMVDNYLTRVNKKPKGGEKSKVLPRCCRWQGKTRLTNRAIMWVVAQAILYVRSSEENSKKNTGGLEGKKTPRINHLPSGRRSKEPDRQHFAETRKK